MPQLIIFSRYNRLYKPNYFSYLFLFVIGITKTKFLFQLREDFKFYLKNMKRGNVFILGYCKEVKILFLHFFRKTPPPVT